MSFRLLVRVALCAVAVLFATPLAAQHGAGGAVASGLGPEARQFDFLVGSWTIEARPKVGTLAAMIHGAPRPVGSWNAKRAFDGRGVEDELRIVDASGNPVSLGRSLRIWSPGERAWLVATLDAYRARFTQGKAHWAGGEMQIEGSGTDSEGKPYRTRSRFSAITADGFRLTQDRSTDGETWDEAVLVIDATRAAATPVEAAR